MCEKWQSVTLKIIILVKALSIAWVKSPSRYEIQVMNPHPVYGAKVQ